MSPITYVTLEVGVEVDFRFYGGDYEKYGDPITKAVKAIPGVVKVEWGGLKYPRTQNPINLE